MSSRELDEKWDTRESTTGIDEITEVIFGDKFINGLVILNETGFDDWVQ